MKIRFRFGDRRDLAGQYASRLYESAAVQANSTSGCHDLAGLGSAAWFPFRLSPPAGRRTRRLAPRAFAAWVPLRYAVSHFHGSAFEAALHNLSFERTAFGVRS
ncbi:hypothetical protein LNV23_23930, partial [Paucibacter sp. DJ1R-11]|uniref:hypothetical protein n=1 Tax=Paucibacter sp. DJ1R-11 TaxID=2893556 RepID=UPI0021E3B5C3